MQTATKSQMRRALFIAFFICLAAIAAYQVAAQGPGGEDITIGVEISAEDIEVGESEGKVLVKVKLSESPSDTVTVQYQTADDTAVAPDDYTSTNGSLIFAPGEMEKTVEITIIDDAVQESAEYFKLQLSNPINGELDPNATYSNIKIIDDDGTPPAVEFTTASHSVSENAGSVSVEVSLSAEFGKTVTVDFATKDGSAVAPGDYTAAAGTLTFSPGETTQSVQVAIADDFDAEPLEILYVDLTKPSNATLANPSQASIDILDDDEGTYPSCDIAFDGVDETKEDNPGAYLSVNANNDNNSQLNNKIPAKRDKDVSPMPKVDPDLKKLSFSFKNVKGTETVKIRVETVAKGKGKIKIWDTQDKKKAITLPAEYQKPADVPKDLYVEGFEEGAAEREISLILEAFDGANKVASDTVKITVTPVLQNFVATVTAGGNPALFKDAQLGWIIDSAPANNETFTLKVESLVTNVRGHQNSYTEFVQNVRNMNNLAGNKKGADLGGGITRAWDFDAPNATKWLIDCANDTIVPFYQANVVKQLKNGVETRTVTDSPALLLTPVNSVLPAVGATTKVDVTYEYVTHCVLHFSDDSIYYFGKLSWNIRYQGDVTQPAAGNYQFAPGAQNKNNGSGAFDGNRRNNDPPPKTGGTIAIKGEFGWR